MAKCIGALWWRRPLCAVMVGMVSTVRGQKLRYGAVALAVVLVACCATSCKKSQQRPGTAEKPIAVKVTLDETGYRTKTREVVAGWINVTFQNRTAVSRDIALVRLGPNKTPADLDKALEDPKALEALGDSFAFEGGATMVPAQSTVSFRTEVFTGQFIFGALPEMVKGIGRPAPLRVGPGDPPLSDPKTPSTVRLDAFSHILLGDLKKSGPQSLSVVGEGPGVHELRLYKVQTGVAPTSAYNAVPAMKDAPDQATPLVRPELGVSALGPGFLNVRDISLTSGDYIMTCFLVDADTGKTYAELGMSTAFQVS